jgi:DNA-directed RNA polymerase subunit RPC12/RpoP
MPCWTLYCANCKRRFTHTPVKDEEASLGPYRLILPAKPLIAGQQEMRCPNCGAWVTFNRFNLRYDEASA